MTNRIREALLNQAIQRRIQNIAETHIRGTQVEMDGELRMAAAPEDAEIFHRLRKADVSKPGGPEAAENGLHVLLHVAHGLADRASRSRVSVSPRASAELAMLATSTFTANRNGPTSSCRSRARSARSSSWIVSSCVCRRWLRASRAPKCSAMALNARDRPSTSGGPPSATRA